MDTAQNHDRRKNPPHEFIAERLRVLVADDDVNFAAYLSTLTKRLGLDTTVVGNGEEAIETLATKPFDLLICDFEMPRRNGLEVVVELRGNPKTVNVYAVMLTVHDDVALKVNALAVGFDDFLSKNCTEIEVVAKVTAARRMIARQQSLDLSARRWESIASRDELTGVHTRRFLFDEASRMLADGNDVALIMFDLDDFKKLNDRYGHIMGDAVLRDVGSLLLRSTRHDDVVARYGGDEFVLLATAIKDDEAQLLASRLAARLEQLSWRAGDETFSVGVSVGTGLSSLLSRPSVEQLIDAADRDLYAHKWIRKNPDATSEQLYLYGHPGPPAEVAVLPAESPRTQEIPLPGTVRLDPPE